MVTSASRPLHARKSSEHRSSSARGTRPTSSTRATSVPSAARELAHVQAGFLDAGLRQVGEVHRHLRPLFGLEDEPEGAHAWQPVVAGPHLGARFGARPRRRRVASTQLTATSGARAPDRGRAQHRVRLVRTEVGCPPLERVRTRVGQVACLARRRRRRRTPEPRTCLPTSARMPGPRAWRSGARPRCRPSATNGTTSSAPNRGCTPSWPASDTWAATARARCRAVVSASRAPGPAIVNTDRWWSASACRSSRPAPQAVTSAASTLGSRPSDTFATHSSTARAYADAH